MLPLPRRAARRITRNPLPRWRQRPEGDDQVTLSLQYSTQWDSFALVGSWFDADGDGEPEKVFYNGYRAHQHVLGPASC